MRAPTLALTAVATAGVLLLGWHEGAQGPSAWLAGVRVVGAPPASPSASRSRAARPTPSRSRAARPTPSRSPAARPTSSRRTVTGALVSTPYGDVQVSAVLVGTRIVDVRALHLTDANGRSRQISADAAPILRQEALAAQSATIDAVSGASYTSEGYRQSLQAALDQAHR